MKQGYIPKRDRKTILFLADDCRLPSGIGTMARELIVGNAHRYNFVHVGAAINHPDVGKVLDLSQEVDKEIGTADASVVMYPYNGYGDPDLIRLLLTRHPIDAIVHFTDPRYWQWLYRISAELRQTIPIFYYHLWDDLPAPHYNKPFYQSCDLLMGISKQSDNIAKLVLGEGEYEELTDKTTTAQIMRAVPKTCYVPHGISPKVFFPVDKRDPAVQAMRKQLFGDQSDPEFVLLYNNRNIRRKMTSDVILAFQMFHDKLSDSQKAGVRLLMHTQPVDEHGTDLIAVIEDLCPELIDKVVFTHARFSPQDMNLVYNSSDVVINIGSNEGWGLSSTEALMAGVPVINNVTGGLQDQLRFEDENGNWIEFDRYFTSNHAGKYRKCGVWGKPVFPSAINLQGSIPTPYIFDDRVSIPDVAATIMDWYTTDSSDRKASGLMGRKWVMSEEAGMTSDIMCSRFSAAIDRVMTNWVPPSRFNLYSVTEEVKKSKHKLTGICLV